MRVASTGLLLTGRSLITFYELGRLKTDSPKGMLDAKVVGIELRLGKGVGIKYGIISVRDMVCISPHLLDLDLRQLSTGIRNRCPAESYL